MSDLLTKRIDYDIKIKLWGLFMTLFFRKRQNMVSRNNILRDSYIYGSRGVSPDNILVGSMLYEDYDEKQEKTSKKRIKISLKGTNNG
jgi:hypothetical protein